MDRLTMILISIFVTLPLLCYVLRTSSIFQNPTYIRKKKSEPLPEPLPETEYVYINLDTGDLYVSTSPLYLPQTTSLYEILGRL